MYNPTQQTMKYYPKLGQPVYAEQYDGTPESVGRINAMLKEYAPKFGVEWSEISQYHVLADRGMMIDGLESGDYVYVDGDLVAKCSKETFLLDYSPSPVPIKPLEWRKNYMYKWAVGVGFTYKYFFKTERLEIDSPQERTVTENMAESKSEAAAQAHHDAQVIQLLNLPE